MHCGLGTVNRDLQNAIRAFGVDLAPTICRGWVVTLLYSTIFQGYLVLRIFIL